MPRFSEMLDRRAEEIKQPPLPPVGEYLFQVKKHPETGEITSKKDGTVYDTLTFEMIVVEPLEVDADQLAEYGKVAGFTTRKQFLFNTAEGEDVARERTLNSIKMFLETLGCFEEGMQLNEGLAASPTMQCRGELTHRADPQDPNRFYAELGRTYKVE